MKVKRTTTLVFLVALAGIVAVVGILTAGSSAAPSRASLVIRHQTSGCHAWSLNGGPYMPTQAIVLRRGGSVSVTDNDVMPHQLVETSGPAVRYTRLSAGMVGAMALKGTHPAAMLARMGAVTKITLPTTGVYHFTTKPGEDYVPGITTVGADNVLRLTIRVT